MVLDLTNHSFGFGPYGVGDQILCQGISVDLVIYQGIRFGPLMAIYGPYENRFCLDLVTQSTSPGN